MIHETYLEVRKSRVMVFEDAHFSYFSYGSGYRGRSLERLLPLQDANKFQVTRYRLPTRALPGRW